MTGRDTDGAVASLKTQTVLLWMLFAVYVSVFGLFNSEKNILLTSV